MNDKDDRAQTLAGNLVGLPAWDAGRTANLVWFQFGAQRVVTMHFRNEQKVVGEWALHVQCAWRITGRFGIEVASHDMYYPASGETAIDSGEFEWDRPGRNACDEKLAKLFGSRETGPFVVTSAQVGAAGALRIRLDDEYTIDVFPNSSLAIEQWRLFQPYSDTADAVFTGQGLES
jgi:hypothetical protein